MSAARAVSLCIEGVDLNTKSLPYRYVKFVSLCIEGVDLNDFPRCCTENLEVSLCIEGVDLNVSEILSIAEYRRLPLHRGSGFKPSMSNIDIRIENVSLCIEGVDLNLSVQRTLHLQ